MRTDEATELEEVAGSDRAAAECRLSGLGVSPGIAIGPAYLVEGGDLPVHESHIPETEVAAERVRFDEAVADLSEAAAQAQGQDLGAAGIGRGGNRLSARCACGDAVEFAARARRRRADRTPAHQCRARCRARNRRNRPQLRGNARPLSVGAGRGCPRRRHPADPQSDQKTLRRLFGRARGRRHRRRRTDPGRHRADGPAAHRRLCRPVRRRRQPYGDRRSRARHAGSARRARLDRARARGGDRHRRRRRGGGHHRPDARNGRPIRSPA